jgi:gamma-glutamylputrescine oxidase
MLLNLLHANDRTGEYPRSWYAATVPQMPARPALEGSLAVDVCIVGAGYTGLSAALHLARAGLKPVVLEAHRIGWGASGRNGGQVGTGQRRGQDELERMLGEGHARRLWELAEESKLLVKEIIQEAAIDCELAQGVIHADHKPSFVPHSRAYAELLRKSYGYMGVRHLGREEIRALVGSNDYHGGLMDDGAFHLHPLKYALGFAGAAERAGAVIHEHSEVTAISSGAINIVKTGAGEVRAKHVLLACNGYLGALEPRVSARVMPINNFIVATEPLGEPLARSLIANNAAVADSRFVINYFRLTPDHRLLFGGGETYGYRFPADIKGFVSRPMLKIFPQLKDVRLTHGWGGTLAITTRRIPLLRRVTGSILSSSGYSGQGVSIATLCGKIAAEAICGQAGRFDVYASIPATPFPGGRSLRSPLLALAMTWYALRDRI